MSSSWCKNIIILISKKSTSLDKISNWRPISLTNCDVKIFMKIMADRLNKICHKLIDTYQQVFIKGRSITNTTLDIVTTMKNESQTSQQH